MEIIESIGFIHYWGFSPAINFLEYINPEAESINIFLTGTNDIRHIMKTLADNCENPLLKKPINIYIHEKEKEIMARNLFFLLLLHVSNLSLRELMELFLDIYGNALIREKSANFIDLLIPELINLIDEPEKHKSGLKELISLKELKFKEKDELVDIFKSWISKIPFKMQELRDQRLRYHYKDRYDFRTNLIDWDYTMNLKDYASIINFAQYREWRQTGVAFESRFSTYMISNRTLSSYLPAKKKISKESCLVRGFWGDIIISPYISFGIDIDYEPEKTVLFKIVNTQHISHSVAVSEFSVSYYISRIQTLKPYRAPIEEQMKKMKDNAAKLNEKMAEIPEEEEKEQEIKEEKNQEKIEKNEQKSEKIEEKSAQNQEKPIDFYEKLLCLKDTQLKIIPIFEDIDKIAEKKKFLGVFDLVILGFIHSGYIKKPEILNIMKPKSEIFVESSRFLVPLKIKEREDLDLKLVDLAKTLKIEEKPFSKPFYKRFAKQ